MGRGKHSNKTTTHKKTTTSKNKLRKTKLLKPLHKLNNSNISLITNDIRRQPSVNKKLDLEKKNPQHEHDQERKNTLANIPFSPDDKILLVGEADLSFARSLIEHHGCSQVTATVLESKAELSEKFPHVDENIRVISEINQGTIKYGFDVTNIKSWTSFLGSKRKSNAVGLWDRIIFNFPHVGGKSTDVNRQVRYNQELLVSFFKHALPFLSPSHSSSILVTLFDGEPYTLWNIRDLARYSHLEVARSFKFNFSAYPGYKHSRTLGVVKSKYGKNEGGWKGEERSARSFVFVRKGEGQVMGTKSKVKQESSDDEAIS